MPAELSKVCSVCKTEKPLDGFHRQAAGKHGREARCKGCRAAYQVAYMANESNRQRLNAIKRVAQRDRKRAKPEVDRRYVAERKRREKSIPEHRLRLRARRAVITAVNSGKLVRQACEHCGAPPPTHGHHEDYSKPLQVIWLCRACHGRVHRKERDGL